MIKRILVRHFREDLMQLGWGRRWMGGHYYLVWDQKNPYVTDARWEDYVPDGFYEVKNEYYEKRKKV